MSLLRNFRYVSCDDGGVLVTSFPVSENRDFGNRWSGAAGMYGTGVV